MCVLSHAQSHMVVESSKGKIVRKSDKRDDFESSACRALCLLCRP